MVLLGVRVVRVVGVCLITFFLLTSLTMHFVLVRLDDRGGNDDGVLGDVEDGSYWRHALLGLMRPRRGERDHRHPNIRSKRRERMESTFRSATQKRLGEAEEGKGGQWFPGFTSTDNRKTRRQIFEERYPPDDTTRIKSVVEGLRKPPPATHSEDVPYDIHNCPATPPGDGSYPAAWNLAGRVLKDWNPDDTGMPARVYQSLCVFDYDADRAKAEAYREAELPFVLKNQPDVLRASERWSDPSYLEELVGPKPQRNEHSQNNHFMFWRTKRLGRTPADWKAPTEFVKLSFRQWYKRAQELERLPKGVDHVNREHWYFRLNGDWEQQNEYLYDELPLFVPTQSTMFMVDPGAERGINCRFGMRGVIAESHFDSSRNWIVVMGGQRRYILSHPSQCRNLELYPVSHPSGRHSKVDWSRSEQYEGGDRPFGRAMASEVVLQAGDALYLPTSWFHFIVSLNTNYQCNARSGHTQENDRYIDQCGLEGMV